MKNYIPGFIISLIVFIILVLVNWQVYSNVMSFGVLIPLLVANVIFCKYLIIKNKRLQYLIFVIVFVVAVFLSLPELTHNQAKEKVMNNYEMNSVKTGIVPIEGNNSWNPFISDRTYFFKGYDSQLEEEISILVNANTGEVIIIDW